MGELPQKERDTLSKSFDVREINWNKGTITPPLYKETILAGFSMGAVRACEYATKHKVDTLVLCSMTPGIESLRAVKAKQIVFVVGGKEDWVRRDMIRLSDQLTKDRQCSWDFHIIPKCDHRMNKAYIKRVLDIVTQYHPVI